MNDKIREVKIQWLLGCKLSQSSGLRLFHFKYSILYCILSVPYGPFLGYFTSLKFQINSLTETLERVRKDKNMTTKLVTQQQKDMTNKVTLYLYYLLLFF